MSKFLFSNRRRVLQGAAALGASAIAGPALALTDRTPIAALWARAEFLKARMTPHAKAIEAAFRQGGTPGWMRLRGAANVLGEERYGVIVAILKATPRSREDLEIQRAAARDFDMVHGPRAWALSQVERAASELRPAA